MVKIPLLELGPDWASFCFVESLQLVSDLGIFDKLTTDDVWVLEELLRMMFRRANNMKPELCQQRRVSDVSGKIVRFVRN